MLCFKKYTAAMLCGLLLMGVAGGATGCGNNDSDGVVSTRDASTVGGYLDNATPTNASDISSLTDASETDSSEDALIQTGWFEEDGTTYYYETDGTPHKGWLVQVNDRYYTNSDGSIATGISYIEGKYYAFGSDGKLLDKSKLAGSITAMSNKAYMSEKSVDDNSDEIYVESEIDTDDSDGFYNIGDFEYDFKDKKAVFEALRDMRYNIGFVMVNVNTGKGLAYNPNLDVYSASCIKGPYIASLVHDQPELIEKQKQVMIGIVQYSDNQSYSAYRRMYGHVHFDAWCEEVDLDEYTSTYNYPHMTPSNLARLWIQNYFFFNTDPNGRRISEWYENPNYSAIHMALATDVEDENLSDKKDVALSDENVASSSDAKIEGASVTSSSEVKKVKTQSKGGWFAERGYQATNDGGIVYPEDGDPYIIAICSEIPSNMAPLEPLCKALSQIYEKTK